MRRALKKGEEVELYMFIMISAVVNYMIFGETSLAIPQLKIVKDKIALLQAKEERKRRYDQWKKLY